MSKKISLAELSDKIADRQNITEEEYSRLLGIFSRLYLVNPESRIRKRNKEEIQVIINDCATDYTLYLINHKSVPDFPETYCKTLLRNKIRGEDTTIFNKEYLEFKKIVKEILVNLEKSGKIHSDKKKVYWLNNETKDVKPDKEIVLQTAYGFELDSLMLFTHWTSAVKSELEQFILFLLESCGGSLSADVIAEITGARIGIKIFGTVSDNDENNEEYGHTSFESVVSADAEQENNTVMEEFLAGAKNKLKTLAAKDAGSGKQYMKIFYLYNIENINLADISAQTGIPQSTVHNRLGIIEQKIREAVTELIIKHDTGNLLNKNRISESIEKIITDLVRN